MVSPSYDDRTIARWRNAVATAFALGGLSISTWGPRLPSLRADLRLSDGALGLLISAVTVGAIAGLAVASPMLSRLGPRRGICLALWFVAVGVAVIGTGAGALHSSPAVLTGFLLVGLGIGSVDVMMNVEGSAVERAAGRTLMPLMHAAWSAGAVIGSGIGAGCAVAGIAPEWQFLAEAVFVAVAAVASVRFIPANDHSVTAVHRPSRGTRLRSRLQGWADPRLLLIGLVMLGVELGEGSANNWLTLAVRDNHHQSDAVAATFLTVFAIGETVTRVVGGPLVDRVGRVRAVRFTTALGVIGMLLFILAAPPWAVLLGALLWAVGVSMGFPLGMSAAAESGPDPAARVTVVASIGYLANLGGPPVVGFLAESFGLLHALWLVVATLVVSFAVAGALGDKAGWRA